MSRRLALLLLPIGPLSVALLRFVLPYYTAKNTLASARDVVAHPGRESAVLWLGLIAVLTLVPGVIAAATLVPQSRLRTTAVTLVAAGYLCVPALLASDLIYWVGAHLKLDPQVTARMVSGLHPSVNIGVGIFIVGHVLGTVLLGVAFLKSGRIPKPVAWVLIVSQPLHFLTAVVLGLAWVDLVAWTMTAFAMAVIAVRLQQEAPRRAGDQEGRSVLEPVDA
jgi:hypothetical protein